MNLLENAANVLNVSDNDFRNIILALQFNNEMLEKAASDVEESNPEAARIIREAVVEKKAVIDTLCAQADRRLVDSCICR